jgi:uncharacterized protein YjiS (DUF1127 family)
MRNATLFEATHREAIGLGGWLRRFWLNRSIRKDLRLLQSLDDYQLRDLGLTRAAVNRLIGLSNATDLRHEMETMGLGQLGNSAETMPGPNPAGNK